MRQFQCGRRLYCVASDIYVNESQRVAREDLRWYYNGFMCRRLFREAVMLHANILQLRGYAVLNAHGGTDTGVWIYGDGERRCRIQSWVDRFDGQFAALFITGCNANNIGTITARHSAVLHAKCVWRHHDLFQTVRRGKIRLFLPPFGYLDDCRQLRRTINHLKASG